MLYRGSHACGVQKDYAHLDFVWAMDAYKQIYPDVLQLLQSYATKK